MNVDVTRLQRIRQEVADAIALADDLTKMNLRRDYDLAAIDAMRAARASLTLTGRILDILLDGAPPPLPPVHPDGSHLVTCTGCDMQTGVDGTADEVLDVLDKEGWDTESLYCPRCVHARRP